MFPRQLVVSKLEAAFRNIAIAGGYNTDCNRVLLWDNVPTEYSQNAIYIKDPREKYEKQGNGYVCILSIEVVAIVVERIDLTADKLGNLLLEDLIKAVSSVTHQGVFINLENSYKWVDTKGKTACEIELNLSVKYKI